MSETNEETLGVITVIGQVAETKQINESVVQQAVQSEEPHRSERTRTLTERGREFQKEKLKGSILCFDGIYERWKARTKVT